MPTPPTEGPLFSWQGRDAKGQRREGMDWAKNPQALRNQLAIQRIRVTRLSRINRFRRLPQTLNARQIANFSRFLSTLLQAGIALNPALKLMQQASTDLGILLLLQRVIQSIESGTSLHQALQHSRMCDDWLIHIVKAAEAMGQLDALLAQHATQREHIQAQRQEIKTALSYPLFVLLVALAATWGLLQWVVPTFEDVFASLQTELPWLTQRVLALSRWIQSNALMALGVGLLLITSAQWLYRRQPALRWWLDWLSLQIPGVKQLVRHTQLTRFFSTLHSLCHAQIQMDQALRIVAPLCSHRLFEQACHDIVERMLKGHALSSAMQQHPLCFEPLSYQMCALGEESGTLVPMLDKLARQYEQQAHHQLKRLGALMEPLIMSGLGVLCAGLIAALYLPIFQMGQLL